MSKSIQKIHTLYLPKERVGGRLLSSADVSELNKYTYIKLNYSMIFLHAHNRKNYIPDAQCMVYFSIFAMNIAKCG